MIMLKQMIGQNNFREGAVVLTLTACKYLLLSNVHLKGV